MAVIDASAGKGEQVEAAPAGEPSGRVRRDMGEAAALPRQFVRHCLLMLLVETPSHGYELLDQLRDLGMLTADAGGLYRELRAMEREGLVRSWWEESAAGPARRTYVPTEEGARALVGAYAGMTHIHRMLGEVISRCRALSARQALKS